MPVSSSGSLLSHLFLLHNLNASWIYDFNGTLWSIATEWQIYFVFALLLQFRSTGGSAWV